MVKRFSLALTCATMVFASTGAIASKNALEICKAEVESVKNMLPMAVDRSTTFINVSCHDLSGRVMLTYVAVLDFQPEDLAKYGLEGLSQAEIAELGSVDSLKPLRLNTWCTDPAMRPLLNVLDIQYRYYMADGTYAGQIDLTAQECPS